MTNSNKQCPGDGCRPGAEGTGGAMADFLNDEALIGRMAGIRNKIIVMSGKGGVGKSTAAVNIAAELASRGLRVGLLDADFHGPSVTGLLKLEGSRIEQSEDALLPAVFQAPGIAPVKVMSIGLLLGGRDEAVIWRGPMKMGAIRQFLTDVEWGELDYLIIDSPPGTGDEPLSVCQLINGLTGAVIVTTPQRIATDDVRKSIAFCRRLNVRVLGVIENMSGFVCPKCGERIDVFPPGGGEAMARETGVPFLGRVPMDPRVVSSGDSGMPIVIEEPGSPVSGAFALAVEPLLIYSPHPENKHETERNSAMNMRIAVPTAGEKLCMHFGHCEVFSIFDIENGAIAGSATITPPPHEPGVIPRWLKEQGATHIIAGGMGARAQEFFSQFGIEVIVGAPPLEPKEVVRQLLAGTLATGENVCDH